MFCSNCNNYNDDNAMQCAYCGMPLQALPKKKKSYIKYIAVISCILIAVICLIIGIILVNGNITKNKYEEKIKNADHFLAELDYDSAILACNEAIKINEKNEAAYIKLAEVYQLQGDMESVDSILTLGYQRTGSKKIKGMIDNLLTYASIFSNTSNENNQENEYNKEETQEIVLKEDFFSSVIDKGYDDYASYYGTADIKFENGSDVIKISYNGLAATLWYVNGNETIIDASSGTPIGNVIPSYIMLSDLNTIIDGAEESISYEEICSLFNETPSVKSDNARNYMLFHYMGCSVYLECDSDGNIEAENTWIKLIVPEAGKNKADSTNVGIVTGKIIDASSGNGISDVKLTFRMGYNNEYGTETLVLYTDETGTYMAELEEGAYTVCAELENYQTEYFEITVTNGVTLTEQNLTMSATLGAGEVRIVLEWGELPRDLDAHLFGNIEGESFHVYFVNMLFKDMVTLDVDDRNSYGPETITIKDISKGTFTYGVEDFSNSSMGITSDALGSSGATVKVYMSNDSQPVVYSVPSGYGVYWEVFRIENGTLIDINQLKESY